MSKQRWIYSQEFKTTDNNTVFVFSVAQYSLITRVPEPQDSYSVKSLERRHYNWGFQNYVNYSISLT